MSYALVLHLFFVSLQGTAQPYAPAVLQKFELYSECIDARAHFFLSRTLTGYVTCERVK